MLNANNVNSLFDDIDNLLKDICEFLSENIKDGNISEKHKQFAQQLVERSKKQLQNINVVTATLSKPEAEEDESYVDMTPTKEPAIEQPPPIVPLRRPTVVEDNRICPYISHSIHEIKDFDKAGYLARKCKLWILDQHIKQFILIKDGWMMIYSNENDKKPSEVIDLARTVVKHIDRFKDGTSQRDVKSFLLITETKTIQFMGKNAKDMEQWISIISKTSNTEENPIQDVWLVGKYTKKELPPEPKIPNVDKEGYVKKPLPPVIPSTQNDEEDETYDEIIHPQIEVKTSVKPKLSDPPVEPEEEENIYESPEVVLTTTKQPTKSYLHRQSKKLEVPPPLPPFNPRKDKTPPPPPSRIDVNIQQSSRPPPILRNKPKPLSLQKDATSVSDGEDEVEYYEPMNDEEKSPINKDQPIGLQNNPSDDEEYDSLVNEKESNNPPKLKDNPKPIKIPQDNSFSEEEDTEYDVPLKIKMESIESPKIPQVDKEGYIKKPPVVVQLDDEDETYDVIIQPESEVKPPGVVKSLFGPKVAGFKPNTSPKVAKVAPPRAPKPAVPVRRSSVTKRTVF